MATSDLNDATLVRSMFVDAAAAMRTAVYRDRSVVRLPDRGRLLATGDLHDNPLHLRKVIKLAALEASEDHHVVLHEMIHGDRLLNGMDFSYRMLARVAELLTRFPNQIHLVLANHELAQMTGRGVSKGAGNSVELFGDALEYVFGESSEEVAEAVNEFIRAMPLALVSEGGVLCAHSLPGSAMMRHFDRHILERDLTDADYQAPSGAAYQMTWGRKRRPEVVAELAEAWGVRLFCLGHEHVETGIEQRGDRVIILNSDHERATVLPLDLGAIPSAEEALRLAVPLAAVDELV